MGVKALNKKGIFFTLITLSLMTALIIIFTPSASVNIGADILVIKTRVTTLNNFVLDLENYYFENILRVSSHKAILALILYVRDNGQFADLNELQSRFYEVALNGTINGVSQPIMQGSTINNLLERMVNTSKDTLNVDTGFKVNSINISQFTPWFVNLRLNIIFSVSSETSSWNVSNFALNADLSIEGFNDTYYLVNTGGMYENKINKTDTFPKGVDEVKDHINYGTYVYYDEAPSFLMRFTNDFSDTSQKKCCGIESLVNPNKITPQKDTSYVDYIFWETASDCSNNELYTIKGISDADYPNFKLDLAHIVSFNIP